MTTIEQTMKVSDDRHLYFDITLPDTLPQGAVKVVVNLVPHTEQDEHPAPYGGDIELAEAMEKAEEIWAYNRAHPEELTASLNKLRGCLKGSNAFNGLDGVTYQRQIRDEWEDRLVKMGLSNNVD